MQHKMQAGFFCPLLSKDMNSSANTCRNFGNSLDLSQVAPWSNKIKYSFKTAAI